VLAIVSKYLNRPKSSFTSDALRCHVKRRVKVNKDYLSTNQEVQMFYLHR